MTRFKVEFASIVAFLCIALLPQHYLNANSPDVRFFISTAVEWQSVRGNTPQQLETATARIYGLAQIIGLYGGGKLAILSGYVYYDPKAKAFEFSPGEGFTVDTGKWEKAEDNHLKVEYRFAWGEKLACPAGSTSYRDCDDAHYRQPAVIATWSVVSRADGTIASMEAHLLDTTSDRHCIALSKLSNQDEVMRILRHAEKELSEYRNLSP
jgi:hypothetical protein